MLYSDLKGKKVFSIDKAKMLGSVEAAYINKATYRVEFLYLSGENEKLLPLCDIFSVNNIITVRTYVEPDSVSLDNYIYYDSSVVVADVEGNIIAHNTDISTKRIADIIVGEEIFRLRSLVSSSKDIIILNPKKRRLEKRAKRIKEIIIEELPVESQEEKPEVEKVSFDKERIQNDYGFLLGRRVLRPITDLAGSLFIRVGTLITDSVIENARKAGKLVDLTINSK